MTNRSIYEGALRLLAQSVASEENSDLEERAPYLLASFCTEAQELDVLLRRASGKGEGPAFHAVYMDLEDEFPLLDRLAPVACLFLGAMLCLDEDSQLSDTLYDRYCDAMATLRTQIPTTCGSVINRYPG